MEGFGVHTSMWTMNWDRAGAERAVAGAKKYDVDFIEIPMLRPHEIDTDHTRALLEKNGLRAICSLGLPQECWASVHPEKAGEYLKLALDKTKACGAEALSGVTFGGIGERTGVSPTEQEYSNIAKALAGLSTVVCGAAEAIILTGGLAHSQMIVDQVTKRVRHIAPVVCMPGENEMAALAAGARALIHKPNDVQELCDTVDRLIHAAE